jgi:hypothetical protein
MDEADLATWRAFLNAHTVVIQRIEQDLKAHGLPPLSWYDVLWPLHRAEDGRLRINQLAKAAGLLRRESVPEDGRGCYAVITSEGAATLRRMWPVYRRHIDQDFLLPLGVGATPLRTALERIVEKGRATPLV